MEGFFVFLSKQQHVSAVIFLQSRVPADLLPLVVITLIIGYADHDHTYFTSVTKFTTAIISIIPLSYFIGMGIARSYFTLFLFCDLTDFKPNWEFQWAMLL